MLGGKRETEISEGTQVEESLKYLTPVCDSTWLRLKQGTRHGGEAFKFGLGSSPASVGHQRAGWNSLDASCRVVCGEAREMSLVWAGVEEVVGAQGCEGGMVYRAMCSVGRMKTEGSRDMLPAS